MGCGASKTNAATQAAQNKAEQTVAAEAPKVRDQVVNKVEEKKEVFEQKANDKKEELAAKKDDAVESAERKWSDYNDERSPTGAGNGAYVDTAAAQQDATYIDGRGIDPTAGPAVSDSLHSKGGDVDAQDASTAEGNNSSARKVGDKPYDGEWADGDDDDPYVGLGELEDLVDMQGEDFLASADPDDEFANGGRRRSSLKMKAIHQQEEEEKEIVEIPEDHQVFRNSLYGLDGNI